MTELSSLDALHLRAMLAFSSEEDEMIFKTCAIVKCSSAHSFALAKIQAIVCECQNRYSFASPDLTCRLYGSPCQLVHQAFGSAIIPRRHLGASWIFLLALCVDVVV